MGGVLILVAALHPLPHLRDQEREQPGGVHPHLRLRAHRLRRRLHQQWRQRSLGLSGKVKLLLQVPLVGVAVWLALQYGGLDTKLDVPFMQQGLESAGSTTSSPSC